MFCVRNYQQGTQVLLAACDPELVGTHHEEGALRLDVPASFYDGVRVKEDELRRYLGMCTVANLVGRKTIEVAVAMGLVASENVREVEGVPHAQLVVI